MKKQIKSISEKLDDAQIMLTKYISMVDKKKADKLRLKREKEQKTNGFKHFLDTMNIKTN